MPIYGKDPPTSPPELEVDGTSALDTRYHVTFSDTPDLSTEVERLGLLLADSGGRLAFNVQHSSPFGGMLGGGGSPTDKDLSRYTVRSQSDWRGGRGLLTSYEDTIRFHDGVADTRFPGKVMLPPAKTQITVTTSDAPENVPASGATQATGQIYAKWNGNGLKAQSLTVSSSHVPVDGDPALQNINPSSDPLRLATNLEKAQSVVLAATTAVTRVRVFASGLNVIPTSMACTIRLSGPTGAIQGTAINSNPYLPSNGTMVEVQMDFSPAVTLTGGVRYWLEFSCPAGAVMLYRNGQNSYPNGTSWDRFSFNGVPTWYEDVSRDWCFIINDGSAATDGAKTRVKLGQPFTMPATPLAITDLRLYLSRSTWGNPDTASVKIFANSGGEPSGAALSTGTLTDPGSSLGWWTVPMTGYTLAAGTTYWIVVEVDAALGRHDATVEWGGAVYTADAAQLAKTNSESGGLFAGWVASASRLYFKINNLTTTAAPYFTPYTYVTRTLAQSFTAPALALAVTKIQILAKRVSWDGTPTLTLGLYTGVAEPTTLVATGSAISASTFSDVLTAPGWLTLPVSYTLSGGIKYWIVLTPTAPEEGSRVEIDWYRDSTDSYAAGELAYKSSTNFVDTVWTTGATDRYFKVNNGTGGATAVSIAPLRFEGKWYAAAGTEILRFNTSTSKFDQVASLAQVVTSLASFNGKIYAGQGDATQIQESPSGNSGDWSPMSGGGATHAFTHLRAYNGYLYALKSTGGSGALDYFNGTTWNSAVPGTGATITAATSDISFTGIVGYKNEIILMAATGIYALSSSFVYQVIDYSNEQYQDNGKNALTWMADGKVYVPVGQSLHAFDGGGLTPVGLDLDDGLPVGQQGHVSCMVGSRNFLFAAVDAGISGRSGVYAFNGAGWHCLAKASGAGLRIRAIGLEQATSSSARPRLWYWEDGNPYYLELPDLTDLPAGYTSSRFDSKGEVESCWLGGELSLIPKDFTSIIVRSTGVVAGTAWIMVYAEIDRSGVWFQVGNVTQSPHQELELLSASFVPTTTAAGSTTQVINTVEEGGLRVTAGEFVRIGTEVAQVSATTKSTLTLVLPLSEAPAAGVTIYPSRPAGREIRYRLSLETADQSQTPIVNRVSLKWGELLLDKRRISMTVRIEDGMRLRGSNAIAYPYSAASLRTRLREWMRRTSPFYITDPTGDQFPVKIVSANETSFAESNGNIGTMWSSRLSLVLDEV